MEGIAIIREALDRGITLLDTSDAYGVGHNEELVGKAIKGRRSEVVLATKFGNLGGRGGKIADGRPEFVMSSCEASLTRLGVDVIDLYYQHRIDPDVPIEDTVGAMSRLIEHGKVRALGLSEARPDTIRRAHSVHRDCRGAKRVLVAVPDRRGGDAEHHPRSQNRLCRLFPAWTWVADRRRRRSEKPVRWRLAPPASAICDGKSRQQHGTGPRVEEIARRKGCTPGQLALAWLLAQGDDIVPIPGTKRKARLLENIAALSVDLTAADLAQISEAVPVGAAAGCAIPRLR